MAAKVKTDIEAYVIAKAKEMREHADLSQSELAALLELSNGFIGQAESSKSDTKYNLNHLNKMALIFKCSLKDFMPDKPFADKGSSGHTQ